MSTVKPLELSVAIKHSSVSIRPFMNGRSNFGLEKHNMVVADGVKHRCPVSVHGIERVKTYITGLNELSPEMQKLAAEGKENKEKKEEWEARVKDIRKTVARAEREVMGNYEVDPDNIDISDKDFWKKVKTFHSVIPDTFDERGVRILTYWDDIFIELDNHGFAFKEGDIRDLLLIRIAEAGGFGLVARTYEEAIEENRFKFYLDKRAKAAGVKVSGRKLRDKAGQELLKLEKDFNKLFYVTKLVSLDSLYYKAGGNTTPIDVLYDDCGKFLDGLGSISSKTEAAEKFLEYAKMDMEELILRCMVQDGTANRYLSYKADGTIYYLKTSTPMGKTVADCILFLKDPLNQDTYLSLKGQLDKDWKS